MGVSCSCHSTSVATAKLVLEDGKLVEFPCAVEVSSVAQKYRQCFICNSDAMEFSEIVSAMRAEEELLPGHLYFALPLSRLRHPLQPEEMAALAVKASLALAKSNINSVVDRKDKERRRSSSDVNSVGGGMRKKRASISCKGIGRSFRSSLTIIQE